MILTVTPNPALDVTHRLAHLAQGHLNRSQSSTMEGAGKGVNVSRILAAFDVDTRSVVTFGGATGRLLLSLLPADAVGVSVLANTRVNITLLERGGLVTKINDAGVPLSDVEADALIAATAEVLAAGGVDWLACCGSLPGGTDPAVVRRLIEAAHDAGARVAVDSSGDALAMAVESGADVVKPNGAELAELTGMATDSLSEIQRAAEDLARHSGGSVLASGGSLGAVLIEDSSCWWARPPAVDVVNTTGAGDALLASFLGGAQRPTPERLQFAVAVATSVCLSSRSAALPEDMLTVAPARVIVEQRSLSGAAGTWRAP